MDGFDLKKVSLVSLRSQVGLVPQETLLMGGSIEENIRYGRPGATASEVIIAAEAANVMEFAGRFPEGLQADVGEDGKRLSGGQRQRVAIARALLKDPRILILDEATSSLDTEGEKLVQEALFRLMEGRTTLVIAHRFYTVQRATRIIVLDKGRIVEEGSHGQLIANKGLYRRLYHMQFPDEMPVSVPRSREAGRVRA